MHRWSQNHLSPSSELTLRRLLSKKLLRLKLLRLKPKRNNCTANC
jgi:hypothetical protein